MPSWERAALMIGFGMGGFLDFLLLHLLLQWHHMISRRLPPTTLAALQRNVFWDGAGQGLMWMITLGGVLILLGRRAAAEPPPTMLRAVGLLLVGWGVFNLVDGVLNHHLLALHDVREDVTNPMAWNVAFLVLAGGGITAAGWLLARAGRSR
ncbi:MAG TPA: DUF2243 domain-containing protein [Longimicrobiales bacterium]|nr:DUF2243 domain-containing protein [Longimicrobiales bacterium]